MVNTLTDGLAIGGTYTCMFKSTVQNIPTQHTLRYWLLAITTANTNAIDDIALLGLVAKTAGLVRTRWSGGTVYNVQLAIFPASNISSQDQILSIRSEGTYRTRSRNRKTSDCFFLYSSSTYLYAPIMQPKKRNREELIKQNGIRG